MRLLLAAAMVAAPIMLAPPAHSDCTLHCQAPSVTVLEQQICDVLDRDGPLSEDPKLTAAYALNLKFDIPLPTAKEMVDNAVAYNCPWDRV